MRNPCSFIPCPNSSLYSSERELAYPGWIHTVTGAFEKLSLLGCALQCLCLHDLSISFIIFLECVRCIHVYVFVCVHICVCHMYEHAWGGQKLMLGVFLYCFPYCFETISLMELGAHRYSKTSWSVSSKDPPCVCLLSAIIVEACHHAWQFVCLLGIWT